MKLGFDHLVFNIMRWVAAPTVRALARTGITPNQITMLRFILFILPATYFFSRGSYADNLIALAFCLLFSYFDFVDGGLAIMKGMQTRLGGWLDSNLDWLSQNLLILGITLGAFSISQNNVWLVVGFVAVMGHGILTIMCTTYNISFGFGSMEGAPTLTAKFNAYKGKIGLGQRLLKNIIDTTTSPFFTFIGTFRYLIVIGIVFNVLPWILLFIAITGNVRWLILHFLYVQTLREGKRRLLVVEILKEIEADNRGLPSKAKINEHEE